MGFIQNGALFRRCDHYRPITPTLCPRTFDSDVTALVGVSGLELDGFFLPQTKGSLQTQAHADMIEQRWKQEGRGAAVIPRLTKDLRNELPKEKGLFGAQHQAHPAFYREYP